VPHRLVDGVIAAASSAPAADSTFHLAEEEDDDEEENAAVKAPVWGFPLLAVKKSKKASGSASRL